MIDDIYPQKQIIGGEGIEVQIDESKFAKRKYHQGHRAGYSSWVFRGINKNKNRFAVVVQNRKEETFLPLTKQYIGPGSHIKSDILSCLEVWPPRFQSLLIMGWCSSTTRA